MANKAQNGQQGILAACLFAGGARQTKSQSEFAYTLNIHHLTSQGHSLPIGVVGMLGVYIVHEIGIAMLMNIKSCESDIELSD